MKPGPYLIPHIKSNKKGIAELNTRPDTLRPLWRYRGKTIQHWLRQWFFGYDSISSDNKSENEQMRFDQTKRDSRQQRIPESKEKIFASHTSDKGLLSKICKEIKTPQARKQITWFKSGQMTWINIYYF